MPDTFAARLLDRRRAAGLTVTALAKRAGLSRQQVGALESGRAANPSLATLRKLAAALGCTTNELVTPAG